ncbi:MAG: FkbM family methyltransferase [Pelobium sp.]
MNFSRFKTNFNHAKNTCKSYKDVINKLLWLYSNSLSLTKNYFINFSYPIPLGDFSLNLRVNNGSDHFIFSEVFDQQCYQLPLKPKSVHYIIDLGANIGLSTIYFSKIYPNAQIAFVEPIPENFLLTQKNLKANNITAHGYRNAISIYNDSIKMTLGDNDYGHKVSNIPFGKELQTINEVTVQGITINEIIKQLKFPKIDLIKIDIEGYEGILLSEQLEWLNITHAIMMEIHQHVDIKQIENTLFRYGFNYTEKIKGNYFYSKNLND